jgi:hypothetical protein
MKYGINLNGKLDIKERKLVVVDYDRVVKD